MKFYYKGLSKDIIKIQELCDICIKKRVVFYKKEPSKQIIMKRPKERFVIELTYLPLELIANTNYKYLFNIIDHFSKFIISFLIENKNANTIVEN